MNGYIGFYQGKQTEVYAKNLWEAKSQVIQKFLVGKKKTGLVSVVLAERNGQQVTHSTASI